MTLSHILARRLALAAALTALAGTTFAQTPSAPAPPVLSTEASPPPGTAPEPAQMSGYPLQVGDLPPGIVAVRVIRQSFGSNLSGQTVLLRVGESNRVLSGVTDTSGRVQFDGLQVGEWVRVRAAVGSELLESQRFQVPAQGGVRMVLVAGVGAGVASSIDRWPEAEETRASAAPTTPTGVSVPMPAPPRGPDGSGGSIWWAIGFATAGLLFAAALVLRRRPLRPAGVTRGTDGSASSHARAVERSARPAAGASPNTPANPSKKGDALFEALVRLEKEHRAGRVDRDDYSARKEHLVEQLIADDEFIERLGRGDIN